MSVYIILLIIIPASVFPCTLESGGCKKNEIPKFNNTCWNPDKCNCDSTSVRPFKIVFTPEMIMDLKCRLSMYREPKPTYPGVGFDYGFNTREMPSWIRSWAEEYPFKQQEAFLNQFPQFKTTIQCLDIHFIRVIPKVPQGVEIVPLLLLHGWPGSVREFYESIPYLTAVSKDRDFVLELVVPSLPGFGFSDGAAIPGLNAETMAVVLRKLMLRLGHETFYVQGGDWGSVIGACMATLFPKEVCGYHTNLAVPSTTREFILKAFGGLIPRVVASDDTNTLETADEEVKKVQEFSGYLHIQATKPENVGVGLSNSPAGLLAYILEKFSAATRPYYVTRQDGGLDHYPRNTLIDNLMMYWVSNSFSTSTKIFSETLFKGFYSGANDAKVTVPTGIVQAEYELLTVPVSLLKTKYLNLVHATKIEDAGHFLALDLPERFSGDVLAAIGAFRNFRENK